MNAPDKIYTDNRGVYAELPVFSQADANVEYIRKDALLEWAEAYKEEADATALGRTDNSSCGESVAMKNLINKLNSM